MADADMLRALRDKYREIKRLRDEHAAGLAGDPRQEMAELARRFPGALRELDELPMPDIEQRLAAIEAALQPGGAPPPWARLQIGYHGWMRAVLRIKRIARGRGGEHAAAVLASLQTEYRPDVGEPPLACIDLTVVVAVLEPSEGRLNPWVYARVAAELGVDPDSVRRALFLR